MLSNITVAIAVLIGSIALFAACGDDDGVPSAAPTSVSPTATEVLPTATEVPPTSTEVPPTATEEPTPTIEASPTP